MQIAYHKKALALLEEALPSIASVSAGALKDDSGVRVFELGELKEFGMQRLAEAHAAGESETAHEFDYGHSA